MIQRMGKESSVGQKEPTICRMKKERDRDGDLSEHKPLEGQTWGPKRRRLLCR